MVGCGWLFSQQGRALCQRHITNRWTRAAGACFACSFIEFTVGATARPRQLHRYVLVPKPMKRLLSLILTLLVCVSGNCIATPIPTQVFDRYGNIRWQDEQARLDNFAIFLMQNPSFIGYMFVWAGRRACHGEAQARAVRAKNYLVGFRKIADNRIVWQDEGYNDEPETILQPMERGKPMLSFDSRVALRDVQFIETCRHGLPVGKRRDKSRRT